MSSIRTTPRRTTSGHRVLEMAEIEQAMQKGRALRSRAIGSALKSLFRRGHREKSRQNEGHARFSPDRKAAA